MSRRKKCAFGLPFGTSLFLSFLGADPALASRNDVYKIDAENRPVGNLRAKSTSFQRLRVEDSGQERKLSSLFNDLPDSPDPSLTGIIENRRYHAMEALLHTDELMFELRFSMDLSMSFDVVSNYWRNTLTVPFRFFF